MSNPELWFLAREENEQLARIFKYPMTKPPHDKNPADKTPSDKTPNDNNVGYKNRKLLNADKTPKF